MFEDFRKGRDLSVALMDDFLHTLEHSRGRNEADKKSASTMWTYRSHLIRYLQQRYHVDYSNEGSYRVHPLKKTFPIFRYLTISNYHIIY